VALAPDIERSVLVGWEAARHFLRFDGHPTVIYVQAGEDALEDVRAVLPVTLHPELPGLVQVSRPSDALAAKRVCEDKVPLQPPEMDPKNNPHYADAVRAQVKYMKGYGFKVRVVPATGSDPNAVSWTYDSVPGNGVDIEKIQDECRVKAFREQ
jgi:hypothetical protein